MKFLTCYSLDPNTLSKFYSNCCSGQPRTVLCRTEAFIPPATEGVGSQRLSAESLQELSSSEQSYLVQNHSSSPTTACKKWWITSGVCEPSSLSLIWNKCEGPFQLQCSLGASAEVSGTTVLHFKFSLCPVLFP